VRGKEREVKREVYRGSYEERGKERE